MKSDLGAKTYQKKRKNDRQKKKDEKNCTKYYIARR